MKRACTVCGRTSPSNRCEKHPRAERNHWSPNRDRGAQARFRTAVLNRDGHRCTYLEDGHRCPAVTDLRAAHIVPLADGGSYDLANGRTLCRTHDRMTDKHAR